ncbi:TadE/TadG family type IV pilus assembly protein [Colwellia sp. BRX10-3]|uniref:TadE family protein n=1 Tax=Colwellia sp. BRX10-3 TaxID=2759844 RepID=UPI0028737952|nr:TadE/TadG family type IV pilus assembly protein [Colwellia sp. BRX10-3]
MEFAIVGGLFFILLFAVFEVGRLFFVWNVLTEASRRGARLATVCYFDTATISAYEPMRRAAMFDNITLAPGLTWSNLKISYLRLDGSVVDAADDLNDIKLVRAEIDKYEHQLIIPGLFITLDSPKFATTLPRESLGVTREKTTLCLPTSSP